MWAISHDFHMKLNQQLVPPRQDTQLERAARTLLRGLAEGRLSVGGCSSQRSLLTAAFWASTKRYSGVPARELPIPQSRNAAPHAGHVPHGRAPDDSGAHRPKELRHRRLVLTLQAPQRFGAAVQPAS